MTAARIIPTLLAALLSTALATGLAPIPVPAVTIDIWYDYWDELRTVADTTPQQPAATVLLRDHMASDADGVVIECPPWAISEDAWYPHAPACYRLDRSLSIAKSWTEMYAMRYSDVEFSSPWYESDSGNSLFRFIRTTWDDREWLVIIVTVDTRSMLVKIQEYVEVD